MFNMPMWPVVEVIENNEEACTLRGKGLYGNRFVEITQEQLDALRDGRVLAWDDREYAMFLRIEPGELEQQS